MASEVVQQANAALAAALWNQIIQEVRPALAASPLCLDGDIRELPTMAYKYSLLPASPAVAAAITDGTAMGNTAITNTAVTITASGVGLGSIVTDFSAMGSLLDNPAVTAYFARGVTEKLETDVTATFTNFTSNATVGTSGVALSLGDLMVGMYELQVAKAPGRITFVGHTVQGHHIRRAIVQSGGAIFGNPNLAPVAGKVDGNGNNAFVTNFLNVNFWQSATCAASGGDKIGLMFVEGDGVNGAIGLVHKWDLFVETLRAPGYPGTQVAASMCYGVALLVGPYGAKFITSGTA
jgi:hypothetical protein